MTHGELVERIFIKIYLYFYNKNLVRTLLFVIFPKNEDLD